MLEARSGRLLVDRPGFREPWARGPLKIDHGRFALFSARKQIRSICITDREGDWQYEGPLSFANADPIVTACNGVPHVIVDGDTLVQLDVESGRQCWRRSFSHAPVSDADEVVCHDEAQIYAAGDGILRCFSLDDGGRVWEHLLGNNSLRWRAVMCGEYVVAHPTDCPAGHEVVLIVCDRRSGRRVQKLVFQSGREEGSVHFDPHDSAPLLMIGNRTIGLGQFPLSSDPRHEQIADQSGR